MKINDYQTVKYVQLLLKDPYYLYKDSSVLQDHILKTKNDIIKYKYHWNKFKIMGAARHKFNYSIEYAKDIVDYIMEVIINNEELLNKFKTQL